jgi:hypothetical protein
LRSKELGGRWESRILEVWGRVLDRNVGGAEDNYCKEEESVIKEGRQFQKLKILEKEKKKVRKKCGCEEWEQLFLPGSGGHVGF